MKKKSTSLLILGNDNPNVKLFKKWSDAFDSLEEKHNSFEYPDLPEHETELPKGITEKDIGFVPIEIKNILKSKEYNCIIVNETVVSKGQMPMFFHKSIRDFCENVASEQSGKVSIKRGDKVIPKLYKLSFEPHHKIVLVSFKGNRK